MDTITDYKIIKGQTTKELQALVGDAIREGWQPFGMLVSYAEQDERDKVGGIPPSYHVMLCQAVVKVIR